MPDKNVSQTPEEIQQALDHLADQLNEMDQAEGVFGEATGDPMSDESLDKIAGGAILPITTGERVFSQSTGEER